MGPIGVRRAQDKGSGGRFRIPGRSGRSGRGSRASPAALSRPVEGSGAGELIFRVSDQRSGFGFQVLGFRVQCQRSGFSVQCLRFRSAGFHVGGSGPTNPHVKTKSMIYLCRL